MKITTRAFFFAIASVTVAATNAIAGINAVSPADMADANQIAGQPQTVQVFQARFDTTAPIKPQTALAISPIEYDASGILMDVSVVR